MRVTMPVLHCFRGDAFVSIVLLLTVRFTENALMSVILIKNSLIKKQTPNGDSQQS